MFHFHLNPMVDINSKQTSVTSLDRSPRVEHELCNLAPRTKKSCFDRPLKPRSNSVSLLRFNSFDLIKAR